MSDNIQHIDVDSDDFLDAPKALRDYAKKLQQDNKRLTESNTDLTGRVTASALGDVLTEFKNPERVKRDLLSDKVDPLDKEAVTKWLESNGEDYARGTETPPANQGPDPDEVAAHERLASNTNLRSPADMSKIEAAQAEITQEMTGDQVIQVFRKHGL